MEATDFVFDVAKSESKVIDERIERLDEKTGVILGFAAVSVAEILGFLILASIEPRRIGSVLSPGVIGLIFFGLLCILVATVLGIWELIPRRTHSGFSLHFLELMVSEGRNSGSAQRHATLALLKEAIKSKATVLQSKSKLALWTAVFVAGAIIAYIGAVAPLLIKLQ